MSLTGYPSSLLLNAYASLTMPVITVQSNSHSKAPSSEVNHFLLTTVFKGSQARYDCSHLEMGLLSLKEVG